MAKQYTLAEFESAGLSVVGPVRDDNQDSILLPNKSTPNFPGSLHAVADGMGGYSHGELASSLAIKNLHKVVHNKAVQSISPAKILSQALENVNLEVFKASQQLGNVRMGTTLTAAYIFGNILHLLHVGDSRAYLIRNSRATCLTNDHTVVGDMVRSRLILPEKIRSHDQRSVLTRAVGLKLFIQPELSQTKLQNGDCIVLCSDGVWSVIEDQEFADLSDRADDMNSLTRSLVDLAIERQTDDNCSVVAIQIRGFRYQTFEEEPRKERRWLGLFRR